MKTSKATDTMSMNDNEILERAAEIMAARYSRGEEITSAKAARTFLQYKLGGRDSEVFAILFLDSQHRIIEYRDMFFGSISSASVYPREIVKASIEVNAAAVILAHNHPSGDATPSNADRRLTDRIRSILDIIDVAVLDHIVIGEKPVSFAERGYI